MPSENSERLRIKLIGQKTALSQPQDLLTATRLGTSQVLLHEAEREVSSTVNSFNLEESFALSH